MVIEQIRDRQEAAKPKPSAAVVEAIDETLGER
jgi:hypothetical protein